MGGGTGTSYRDLENIASEEESSDGNFTLARGTVVGILGAVSVASLVYSAANYFGGDYDVANHYLIKSAAMGALTLGVFGLYNLARVD